MHPSALLALEELDSLIDMAVREREQCRVAHEPISLATARVLTNKLLWMSLLVEK